MKITFKDVGQGDSIILEWTDKNISKMGIIDCCRLDGKNPVLEHLKTLKWENHPIEFILLTHPHYDHYSGMPELLNYCKSNRILIKRFGHSFDADQRYLDWANVLDNHNGKFAELIEQVIKMEEAGEVQEIELTTKNWTIDLNEKYTIRSISPSDKERRKYTKEVKVWEELQDNLKASQYANLFSNIFMLSESDMSYVLLTSDTMKETFDRISLPHNMEYFVNKNLILAQVPHHGSIHNHRMPFWRKIRGDINTPAVISAGNHKKYKHPAIEVVEDFKKNYYEIYSTKHIQTLSQQADRTANILNTNSKLVHGIQGDQVFQLTPDAALYVS